MDSKSFIGFAEQFSREFRRGLLEAEQYMEQKEATTMQVSYNGFTGELVKLEREIIGSYTMYNLSIYDSEKQVTHSFTGVKLEDVKFMGGTAAMSGTLNIGEVSFSG